MSMISEQVKKIREFGKNRKLDVFSYDEVNSILSQAADAIEALSAKLQAANDELNRWHTDHINEKIKNPFAYTSTLICHNCDHKDEYIEELEAELEELKAANMENGGGWIACEDRLPDKSNSYLVTKYIEETEDNFEKSEVCSEIFWTRDNKWDCERDEYCEWKVIAWQPLPEPYRP